MSSYIKTLSPEKKHYHTRCSFSIFCSIKVINSASVWELLLVFLESRPHTGHYKYFLDSSFILTSSLNGLFLNPYKDRMFSPAATTSFVYKFYRRYNNLFVAGQTPPAILSSGIFALEKL